MSDFKALRPILPILIGACVMLSIANGLRHSMGMFMQPLTQDLGIAISDFTLAIAVQNLLWGFAQPVAGAWAVRYGFRPMMITGAVLYVAGLIFLATAHGMVEVMIGAGITIGIAMACVGSSIAHAVASRGVPVAMRSTILGVVSATGSLGSLFAAPLGQLMTQAWGWRAGVFGFAALALVLLPAAWYSGKADRIPLASNMATDRGNAFQALAIAFRNPMFVVLAVAFFVCGMQLVFLTTHLPSYLQICGMDPMLSAQALGMIGGFNVLGSLFFGWAGGRYNKLMMLGGIYIVRSLALGWYFLAAPTQTSTLVFAAIMGFLWLGVVLAAVFLPKSVQETTLLGVFSIPALVMFAAAVASYFTTKPAVHEANDFNFHPVQEVGYLFVGIFLTMIPALQILQSGQGVDISSPMQYYFTTGALSAFLDNAPTYLSFLAAAMGQEHLSVDSPADVMKFAAEHAPHLIAISLGAVFFGAGSYIGNGPNFMVKSIADKSKVGAPSFLAYMLRFSIPILLPILIIVGWMMVKGTH